MTDRDFINNLIKVYFSDAKEPHQATLNNAVVNRLNDIADKLEKQEKVLKIIKERQVNIALLMTADNVEEYNFYIPYEEFEKYLTEEEFELLKRWLG